MSVAVQAPPLAAIPLARAEGRCLLRHPLLLGGLALSILLFAAGAASNGAMQAMLFDGMGCFPLAAGALLAANAAGLRARRDGAEELLSALPAPRWSQTAGQLLAVAWTLPVAMALVAGAYLASGAADGLVVAQTGLRHVPSVIELVQGPLAVAALGALGVLLARVAPSPLVAPPTVVALLALEVPFAVWQSGAGVRWVLPFVSSAETVPGSWVPCEPGDIVAHCAGITGFDTQGMALHAGLLVAAIALMALAARALARRRTA